MNKKISVFILLILLASSFKYRAKTVESESASSQTKVLSLSSRESKEEPDDSFEKFSVSLQKANQELASGNPEPFHALWSKSKEVIGVKHAAHLGENDISTLELKFSSNGQGQVKQGEYSFENVTTEVGSDLACLIQTEHYRQVGEKPVDLQVTILCRKEIGGWKIVQRQAANINLK